MRFFFSGIAPGACLVTFAAVVAGCGGSDGVTGDGSGLADAAAVESGGGPDGGAPDAVAGDGTAGDDGSSAGEGGAADGFAADGFAVDGGDATMTADAPAGGDDSTDDSSDDAGDAETGVIIIVGDDGPGDLEAGVTVYSPCGPSLQCNVQTEFCFHTEGPHAIDGGLPMTWACNPVPSACRTNPPTCACLSSAGATNGCMCDVQGSLLVTCLYP